MGAATGAPAEPRAASGRGAGCFCFSGSRWAWTSRHGGRSISGVLRVAWALRNGPLIPPGKLAPDYDGTTSPCQYFPTLNCKQVFISKAPPERNS